MNLEKEDKIISDKLNEYVEFDAFDKQEIWNRIEDQLSKSKEKKFPILRYISIAALFIFFIGVYFVKLQSKNNIPSVTKQESLVKADPHSINTNASNSILAAPSLKNSKNRKVVNFEQITKTHLNTTNKSSVVSNNSTSNDIQEPILVKAKLVTVLENQVLNNSDLKASIISAPLVILNSKNVAPKRKYAIVHINELARSDDGLPALTSINKEKVVIASNPPLYSNEQEAVQKYLSIKLISNKSSNSLNYDHEK